MKKGNLTQLLLLGVVIIVVWQIFFKKKNGNGTNGNANGNGNGNGNG